MKWARHLCATSRLRVVLDLFWCVAFGVSVTLILMQPSGASTDQGVRLDLVQGTQTHGIYRKGDRVGSITWIVLRSGKLWQLDHLFQIKGKRAARIRQWLRADLSLARLSLRADISRLEGLTSHSEFLLRHLKEFHEIQLQGDCAIETGTCMVAGRVGRHPVQFSVTAGRGPVDTSAIYRLLARGSLGREAEVSIFDPLSLRQRVVSFRIEGQQTLELRSGTFAAIRVRRDLEGLNTRVWIDRQGRVLKEELPLGFMLEHESWSEEVDSAGDDAH
jgi:hypothetical protein